MRCGIILTFYSVWSYVQQMLYNVLKYNSARHKWRPELFILREQLRPECQLLALPPSGFLLMLCLHPHPIPTTWWLPRGQWPATITLFPANFMHHSRFPILAPCDWVVCQSCACMCSHSPSHSFIVHWSDFETSVCFDQYYIHPCWKIVSWWV